MTEPAALLEYDPLLEPLKLQPFSVLHTTSAAWKARKVAWSRLGIRPEVKGRAGGLLLGNQRQLLSYDVECDHCHRRPPKGAGAPAHDGQIKLLEAEQVVDRYPAAGEPCMYATVLGCPGRYATVERASQTSGALSYGTSIFDPVLCEAMYRWYSPADGVVLDPFAGGAVRGLVAWKCGRGYVGVELRPEQVSDNRDQAQAMVPGYRSDPGALPNPHWVEGDSRTALLPLSQGGGLQQWGPYDFILTCPPYYDAEVYSDDPRDLSNAEDHLAFQAGYYEIMAAAAKLLAPNRYVAVVIGEARDSRGGHEYGLVQDTCQALTEAGLVQHAHMILENSIGTLPLRMPGQWRSSRAPGRHHQHVLVYRNGPAKACAEAMEPLKLFDETSTTTEEAPDA